MTNTFRIEIPVSVQDKTEPGISNATKKVSAFEKSMKSMESKLNKIKSTKVDIAISAVDKASAVLDKVKNSAKNIGGKIWKTTVSVVDKATAPLQGILNLLRNPILQAGAVLGVSFGIADSLNTFKDFEAAMSQVQAISGATSGELETLTAKAKEMGATTKYTATEAAEAFNYMAMAGWKTQDMLSGIEGILSLAAASGTDLATTSDIVTDAITAFGLSAKDAGHFSDVLAVAASNANTTVVGMGETFKYAGTMAGTLGYSIEDVALATGLMANSGIKSTMAGTALNAVMTRLATDAGASSTQLGALGILTEKLGVQFYDAEGNARDLSDVLGEMRKATANMNDEDKTFIANKIAGMEAQKGLMAILNASEEDYNKLADAINNADGAAANMSETMLDNLNGSLTILQSSVDGAKIRLGERLAPFVRTFAEWVTAQMPGVNSAIDEMMDFVEGKIDAVTRKIKEFTSSEDWQNADFFGKVAIAWDELIAEPFGEWWDTKGRAMMADKASDIGKGIGTAVSSGLLAILGIDIDGAVDDGTNIGASFGKGLIEGFEASGLKSKIGEVIKSIFSNAADLLPGGDAPGLSSVLSAALLAKVGGGLLGGGMKGISLGKSVAGSSTLSKMIGKYSLAPELAGTGLAGGSGLMGMLGSLGMNLGAGAASSAGMVLAGGGALAGGATATVSLISGIKDLKTALAENVDAQKSNAYGKSGAYKLGGVAAGAIAGAAIGSAVPVIGTAVGGLVGAGVGGIAGALGGKKEIEDYEESMRAFKIAQEQAKYASQELKDALADTGVTAEEFADIFARVAGEDMASRFGDVKLSLAEIKKMAKDIAMDSETAKEMERFSDATLDAANSFSTLESAFADMERLNWKAGLRLEMDESSINEYKSGIDNVIQSAKTYIEDKHYEATVAIDLLMDDSVTRSQLKFFMNGMYEKMQSDIASLGTQLTAKVEVALEDGVLQFNEQAEIESLQRQINEITNKVATAQNEAKLEALKIKYSGADLDAESFQQLQTELNEQVQQMTDSYDEALEIAITNLKLTYPDGGDPYEQALKELTEGYEANIEELAVNVETFQLDAIAEAFGSSLDEAMPDITATTSEKLKMALDNAMAEGIEPAEWDSDTVTRFLGLDNLDEVAKSNLAELMGAVAETIPETIASSLEENADYTAVSEGIAEGIGESLGEADFSEPAARLTTNLADFMTSEENVATLETAAQTMGNQTNTFLNTEFSTNVGNDAGNQVPGNVATSLDRSKENVRPGCDAVAMEVESYLTSQISGLSINASPTVTITPNYVFSGNMPSIGVPGHAAGGIVSGKQLSWVGEEGPEVIIPTVPNRRSRALELYEKAGEMLGVGKNAEGGIVGGFASEIPSESHTGENGGNGTNNNINVEVNVAPQIAVSSGNSATDEEVRRLVETALRNMMGDISDSLASKLKREFNNMGLA